MYVFVICFEIIIIIIIIILIIDDYTASKICQHIHVLAKSSTLKSADQSVGRRLILVPNPIAKTASTINQ
jgi:hypothetical protein